MVECVLNYDSVFGSLADPTRRDILQRVTGRELSVGEIAKAYNLSFAAISKHLKILEQSQLVTKHRHGKQQLVQASPQALHELSTYLERYRQLWEMRFDALEAVLAREQTKVKEVKHERTN